MSSGGYIETPFSDGGPMKFALIVNNQDPDHYRPPA